MEIEITDLKIEYISEFSDHKRYYAVVNKEKVIQYESDGLFSPHLTENEFIELIKNKCK